MKQAGIGYPADRGRGFRLQRNAAAEFGNAGSNPRCALLLKGFPGVGEWQRVVIARKCYATLILGIFRGSAAPEKGFG